MNWFLLAFKNYAVFSGRATRKEFWSFMLFYMLIDVILGQFDQALGLFNKKIEIGLLGVIFGLLLLIPSISVSTRRLHDIGKSGWWQLLVFVPLIGWIALIAFFCRKSYPFQNAYGPNSNAFEMSDKSTQSES